MPRKGEVHFEELSPNQTARDLFGHLGKGDKVAIITFRFCQHVEALVGYSNALLPGQVTIKTFVSHAGAKEMLR
jgi:hypothetical protein